MNKNFEDYLKAILEHYETVKNGKDADFLEKPTPGNLKKLCVQLLEKGLNNADEQTFMNFFFPTGEQTLLGLTRTMNADSRLRTPSDFLRTEQGLTNNRPHANLVAVLVGFEPRPFTKFQDTFQIENEEDKKAEEERTTAVTDTVEMPKNVTIEKKAPVAKEAPLQKKQNEIQDKTSYTLKTSRNKKIALVAAVLLFGAMSGFIIHKTIEKHCMVWREDHFEKIECEQSTISSIAGIEKINPYNEELFAQQKIIPTDTTTFFKNGQSSVYYLLTDNKIEFFKQPGPHPVYSDRKLRRITKTIIRNWKNNRYATDKP